MGAGAQGSTGPQGPQGAQGPQGIQGPVGPLQTVNPSSIASSLLTQTNFLNSLSGAIMLNTSATLALTGPKGPMGPMGAMGPIGPLGPMGPIGPPGAPGNQGQMGPPGPIGLPGVPGAQGNIGPLGPVGPIGPVGGVGPIGPPGAQGNQGAQGNPGAKGDKGDTGSQGIPGVPGLTGPVGPPGIPGIAGPQGIPGALSGIVAQSNLQLGTSTVKVPIGSGLQMQDANFSSFVAGGSGPWIHGTMGGDIGTINQSADSTGNWHNNTALHWDNNSNVSIGNSANIAGNLTFTTGPGQWNGGINYNTTSGNMQYFLRNPTGGNHLFSGNILISGNAKSGSGLQMNGLAAGTGITLGDVNQTSFLIGNSGPLVRGGCGGDLASVLPDGTANQTALHWDNNANVYVGNNMRVYGTSLQIGSWILWDAGGALNVTHAVPNGGTGVLFEDAGNGNINLMGTNATWQLPKNLAWSNNTPPQLIWSGTCANTATGITMTPYINKQNYWTNMQAGLSAAVSAALTGSGV